MTSSGTSRLPSTGIEIVGCLAFDVSMRIVSETVPRAAGRTEIRSVVESPGGRFFPGEIVVRKTNGDKGPAANLAPFNVTIPVPRLTMVTESVGRVGSQANDLPRDNADFDRSMGSSLTRPEISM